MILGFLGESKAGKDYVMKLLKSGLDLKEEDINVIRAADILKKTAEKLYPEQFSVQLWEKSDDTYRDTEVIITDVRDSTKTISITRRGILQYLGDYLKEKDPTYVNRYLKESISSSDKPHVFIPDIRNSEEASSVLDSGKSSIIKISRHLKYRYPEIWEGYIKTLSHENLGSITGFKEYLKVHDEKIYNKLHHNTETSIEEVPNSLISFKFINEPTEDYNRRVLSLISKLRPNL